MKPRSILAVTVICAAVARPAYAQDAPRSPDEEMGGCHEGLLAIEHALKSVEDPEVAAAIGVIIHDLYRATDMDDGPLCRFLIPRAFRILEHGPLLPPQAVMHWDPPELASYTMITFDGSRSTDPDSEIVRYTWDLGDGTMAAGPIVQHMYRHVGDVSIRLTVVDSDGLTSTQRMNLLIHAPDR